MSEAGTTEGAAALAAEARKHTANDPKGEVLGWVCVPMAVETYSNWDKEARSTINQLASHLSIISSLHMSRVIFEIYGKSLVRSNSRAIQARGWSSEGPLD